MGINKANWTLIVGVDMANPNGDPSANGRPREDTDGYGLISAECIKRKIRNRLQDMGYKVLYQLNGRGTCDEFGSIEERVKALGCEGDAEKMRSAVLDEYIDVRLFGATIAVPGGQKDKKGKQKEDGKEQESAGKGISIGIPGAVTVRPGTSVAPVHVVNMGITKSMNGLATEKGGRSSDTMGHKYYVENGVYVIHGTVNGYISDENRVTEADIEALKEAISTLFENDGSAARPEGSMEIMELFWWQHNCTLGQYRPRQIQDSVKITYTDHEPENGTRLDREYHIEIDDSYQREGNRLEYVNLV